jgi:transketolase N-terminal domain/subunit
MIRLPRCAYYSPYSITRSGIILSYLMKPVSHSRFRIFLIQIDLAFVGHRVATQYLLATLNGDIPAEHLLHYRAANSKLPGHPELGLTPGVKFSSGRLGHMWPLVNGIALAHRDKTIFCLGSDGSQQEGNDAEAARLAVAKQINVKLIIDDNNVTISGHPSDYLKGYNIVQTLQGHGMHVEPVEAENLDQLWNAFYKVLNHPGPAAS